MSKLYNELLEAYNSIKDKIPFKPEIALVLGSGLGDFADKLDNRSYISYNEIENFPVSTVSGHVGTFVFGTIDNKKIVAMQGRVHHYEGYEMQKVVMPIRLMKLFGAEIVILTNAAGGINESFTPGTLMMITDQITTFVPSPLIGENVEELGERFPDMSNVYDEDLQLVLKETAKSNNISLREGVYLQTTGPSYETPAEIKMFRSFGADAVGMSTTCEAMAAKHMGMKVAGVSCITNLAAGMNKAPLNHLEVKETANKVAEQFTSLIMNFIKAI